MPTKKNTLLITLLLGVIQLQNSCTKDKTAPLLDIKCSSVSYTYSIDILPILLNSCANGQGPLTGCHDAWISNYSSLKSYINSGIFQEEVLIYMTMPVPNNNFSIPPLTNEELTKIDCWIQSGAPQN